MLAAAKEGHGGYTLKSVLVVKGLVEGLGRIITKVAACLCACSFFV